MKGKRRYHMDHYSWDYRRMYSIRTRKQAKKGTCESRETGDVSGKGDTWMVAKDDPWLTAMSPNHQTRMG